MILPNFIVIGAPKCGTTSLHMYLSEHPEIFMTEQKEIHFFLKDDAQWGTWRLGLDWYSSLFESGAKIKMRGEASPGYMVEGQTESSARKIADILPDAKLIYLMREPMRRVKSHYLEQYFSDYLPKGLVLNDIISNRGNDNRPYVLYYKEFVYTSLYNRQLSILLKHHKLNNIFVSTQEQLQAQPKTVLSSIFNFLEVDPFFVPESLNIRLNVSDEKRKRVIDPLSFISNSSLYRKISENIPDRLKDKYRKVISKKVDVGKITELSVENEQHLRALLYSDIIALEQKTGIDLSEWLQLRGTSKWKLTHHWKQEPIRRCR